jgi:hypothetical protein
MRYAICYDRFKRKKIKQKSTFVNILKDNVTLIFFSGNQGDSRCKQGWKYILAIILFKFHKNKLFLDIFVIQICFNINNDKESMNFFQIIL